MDTPCGGEICAPYYAEGCIRAEIAMVIHGSNEIDDNFIGDFDVDILADFDL